MPKKWRITTEGGGLWIETDRGYRVAFVPCDDAAIEEAIEDLLRELVADANRGAESAGVAADAFARGFENGRKRESAVIAMKKSVNDPLAGATAVGVEAVERAMDIPRKDPEAHDVSDSAGHYPERALSGGVSLKKGGGE